jgi:tRNA threonylcarbamoyladenosine biosynthesis protein TsaE
VSPADPAIVVALPDEAATVALARRLAPALGDGGVVYLEGELGTGKSTFARAMLRALGVDERVKSPTYSLIERYAMTGREAFHLDLYRITRPGELESLGLDEIDPSALALVEWPDRGGVALPPPDLRVAIEHQDVGRRARLTACSVRAQRWLDPLTGAGTATRSLAADS